MFKWLAKQPDTIRGPDNHEKLSVPNKQENIIRRQTLIMNNFPKLPQYFNKTALFNIINQIYKHFNKLLKLKKHFIS